MANKTEHIYTGLLSLFYNYYFNVLFLSFKGQKVDTDFFVLVLMAFILCASFTRMQCHIFLRGKTDNCMGNPFYSVCFFHQDAVPHFSKGETDNCMGNPFYSVGFFHQDAGPHL